MGETTVAKNAKGHGYNYADLASVNKYLEELGIKYYQYTDLIDGNDYIYTVPIVDGKEQPARRGCRIVQANLQGSGKGNPAQEQGSALTYARRYSVLMAFGLAAEDDDGAALNKKPETPTQTTNQTTAPEPISPAQKAAIRKICEKRDINLEALYKQYNLTEETCTKEAATKILTRLNK